MVSEPYEGATVVTDVGVIDHPIVINKALM